MNQIIIRPTCLCPCTEEWEKPTGDEIREVLRLAGFSGAKAAQKIGLGKKGDRTIRRWISEETNIPYAAWALLCDFAGLGNIWRDKDNT